MTERLEPKELVCIAVVASAHGVRGALRLRAYTEAPDNVAAYGPVYDRTGRRLFRLEVIGEGKGGVIVRAEGIRDRDAADALRGTEFYVPRAALPEPGEDEFYHADLIGLPVEDRDGRRLGRVRALLDFGAGGILEVETEAGESLPLPFTREVVPVIDLERRRIVVEPPAVIEARPQEVEA